MPFALRHRDDPMPYLDAISGLEIRREQSPERMAELQGRSVDEMEDRFSVGHRAYVAYLNGEAAAWGWLATRSAQVGELNAAFEIRLGERYLWNFVTLEAHRGKGVYPRLLQAIVLAEAVEASWFWIGYAPENHASGAGIRKAGFTTLAEVSFDATGRAAVKALAPGGDEAVAHFLGLPVAESVSACWRCASAGKSAAMSCAPGSCTCDYQRRELECAA